MHKKRSFFRHEEEGTGVSSEGTIRFLLVQQVNPTAIGYAVTKIFVVVERCEGGEVREWR